MAFFPIFVDIEHKNCLIVGGGKVAWRKVVKLQEYGAKVTVISPDILAAIEEDETVICRHDTFREEDLEGMELCIAATDDAGENHRIAEICRAHRVPVNAVDQLEDCSFIFSSMVRQQDVVAAVSSSGKSPVLTQYLKAQIEKVLTQRVGEANELLGKWRPYVKECFATEAERKVVFAAMFSLCMEGEELPEEEAILALVESYRK